MKSKTKLIIGGITLLAAGLVGAYIFIQSKKIKGTDLTKSEFKRLMLQMEAGTQSEQLNERLNKSVNELMKSSEWNKWLGVWVVDNMIKEVGFKDTQEVNRFLNERLGRKAGEVSEIADALKGVKNWTVLMAEFPDFVEKMKKFPGVYRSYLLKLPKINDMDAARQALREEFGLP